MTTSASSPTTLRKGQGEGEDAGDRPPVPAFFAAFWPPNLGGNGIVTYVEAITARLPAHGVRPIILAPRVGPTRPGDPTVLEVPSPPRLRQRLIRFQRDHGIPGTIAATLRDAVRHGADLLEIEESFGWAANLKPLLPPRSSPPIVCRLHGPWFLNGTANGAIPDDRYHDRVARERLGILAADAISAPSRSVLELTRRHYGIPLENAVVIPNPIAEIPENRRWRLDDADRHAIVFIGRFDRHKGGDVMIDAFARVAATHPNARLLFVGEDRGLNRDDGQRTSLPDYVAAHAPEAAGRIELLGRLPAEKIADLRRQALVTVAPSRYENLSYAVLEAAALGAPLVASHVGGNPEIVDDGESALLVPPDDPDALAQAVNRLLDDPQLAARLGQAAANRAHREFQPDTIVARTLDFYREVLHRHRHRHRA